MELTKEQKAELERLHALGYGRNAIAKQMGINDRWITEAAQSMNLVFSRRYLTDAARKAVTDDASAKRQHLALMQLEDAMRMREMLYEPCTVGQFGGKDNVWNEVTLDRPTFSDMGRIQQAVYSASSNAAKLLDADAGTQRSTINLVVATAEKLGLTAKDGA